MSRKPCAQSVPQLKITEYNCGCKESKGRFSRIARNAILPFYYDCSKVDDPVNNLDECEKVFYIKNPKFFAGTAKNNPGSLVTQAMRYSRLARSVSRNANGRSKTLVFDIPASCINLIQAVNWYNLPENEFRQRILVLDQLTKSKQFCTCTIPWNVKFNSTSRTLRNV
jgi:hypothetical protein